jgi:SAM-dependent methyltransferase
MGCLERIYPVLARRRAVDFGCGASRLTQALARYFEHVTGVDISAPMIELARAHDRTGGHYEYLINTRPDLSALPSASFDFIYSNMTLQHMPGRCCSNSPAALVEALPNAPRAGQSWLTAMSGGSSAAVNRISRCTSSRDPAWSTCSNAPAAAFSTSQRTNLAVRSGRVCPILLPGGRRA